VVVPIYIVALCQSLQHNTSAFYLCVLCLLLSGVAWVGEMGNFAINKQYIILTGILIFLSSKFCEVSTRPEVRCTVGGRAAS